MLVVMSGVALLVAGNIDHILINAANMSWRHVGCLAVSYAGFDASVLVEVGLDVNSRVKSEWLLGW